MINARSVSQKQDKLLIAMERNVKAEWAPRFEFLQENNNRFFSDKNLKDMFAGLEEINDGMQKLTIWGMNKANFKEDTLRDAKKAFKVSTIVMVTVTSVLITELHRAGKDLCNYPRYEERWRDEEGNLYDENGHKLSL